MSWKFNPFTGKLDWTESAASGALPTPAQDGQVLLARSGAFAVCTPLTSPEGWLVNTQGDLLISE